MDRSKMYSEDITSIRLNSNKKSLDTDRYDRKTRMILPDGNITRFLRSHEIKPDESPRDTLIDLPIHYQYDPWRVAYDYYGDEKLFWIILGANNLFSMFDLEVGMKIRIPDKESIFGTKGLMVVGDGA